MSTYRILYGVKIPLTLLVGWELCDMFNKELHQLDVSLPEGSHQTRDPPVVLTVHVCFPASTNQ